MIRDKGVLTVVTRNANTTFFYGREGISGLEYDLVKEFTAWLDVDVDFIVNNSIPGIFEDLKNGRADLAAAGLTRTSEREKYFLFGPDYFSTHQVLITHKDNARINHPEEISHCRGIIPLGASYQNTLDEFKQEYPDMQWEISEELSVEQVIEKVALKEYSCSIVDENIFRINQRFYPELRATAILSDEEYFAWVLGREGRDLQKALYEWFEEFRVSGRYEQLIHKYYGHADNFDYVDLRTFHRRIESTLPKFRKLFEDAGAETGVQWSLLAALSYQESHWNKYARSPTGVRGIMMLTRRTAAELGVRNRLNVAKSINAGARYLKDLYDRVPASVHDDDRILFAIAAYNIGMGHIFDARKLARMLDKNPDSWVSLRTVLPLLSQKKYYKDLRYGYARGYEPVHYVTRIMSYKQILDNYEGEIP